MRLVFYLSACLTLCTCTSSRTAPLHDKRKPASAGSPLRCFDPTPIDEVYRTILGRNSRSEEAAHFANLVVEGEQVAYFEPYLASDCAKNPEAPNCHQPTTCYSWVDYTADPDHVGPVFYSGDAAAQNQDYSLSALYRTLFGELPDSTQLRIWTKKLHNGIPLPTIAQQMQSLLPPTSEGSWQVIDDVFMRILGRAANRTNCSFRDPEQPKSDTDCSWFWGVARGLSVFDLIHGVRSLPEAVAGNESPKCLQANPNQRNPHALGEYIRQTYRLLLRRNPSTAEMNGVLSDYSGGSTRKKLNEVANKILASSEYNELCSQ